MIDQTVLMEQAVGGAGAADEDFVVVGHVVLGEVADGEAGVDADDAVMGSAGEEVAGDVQPAQVGWQGLAVCLKEVVDRRGLDRKSVV